MGSRIIKEMLEKPVKDRSEREHFALIKYFGGARKYLLTMGEFKEDPSENHDKTK